MTTQYSWDYMKKYRSDMQRHVNISRKAVDYMSGKVAAQRKAEEMIKKTTKSRVIKRFAKKVGIFFGIPLLFLAVWVGSAFLLMSLGVGDDAAMLISTLVFVLIPGMGLMLKHMYSDSKSEIERENRELMRNLTDGYQ